MDRSMQVKPTSIYAAGGAPPEDPLLSSGGFTYTSDESFMWDDKSRAEWSKNFSSRKVPVIQSPYPSAIPFMHSLASVPEGELLRSRVPDLVPAAASSFSTSVALQSSLFQNLPRSEVLRLAALVHGRRIDTGAVAAGF
jgi:hypothetical protein